MMNVRYLLSLLLVLNSAGCFRVVAVQDPIDERITIGVGSVPGSDSRSCAFAVASISKDAPYRSPETIFHAAQCYEVGYQEGAEGNRRLVRDITKSTELYTLAAQCGLPEAEQKLIGQGIEIPEERTAPGLYYWPYGRLRAEKCGYRDELTTVGWATAVVAAPVLVAGAIVGGAVLVVGGLSFCVIQAIATKGRCM
jgi:hypothetical protein